MDNDIIDEMMDEEFSRVETIDAAFALIDQLKHPNGAIRLILVQAHEDARDAVRQLVSCNPADAETVRDLQWRVTRFDDLCRYVNEIVEAGRSAHDDLTEEQSAELDRLLKGDSTTPKD